MSSSVSMSSPGEFPAAPSFAARLAGIFISPRETFASIVSRSDFLAPLITLTVVSLIVTEVMLAKVGMERMVRTSIEQSGRASAMSSEQMQQAIQQGTRVGAVIAHAAGVLGAPILLVIIAGIGLLVVNAIFGAQIDFSKAFSMTCYAYLVTLPRALMALAIIMFGDPERFNPQNPTPSNPGFFLNPLETSRPLLAFASSLDIFTLWFIVLLGIALSEAAGRKVRALPISLTYLALWMITALARVGAAMLA